MALSEQEIERAFALIEQAAINGERAPQGTPHGPLPHSAITTLYRAGRVRGEIHPRNWRVLTILAGPHKGKSTKAPPWGGKPYKILDVRNTATRAPGVGKPSAPRLLSSAEIRKLAP